MLESKKKMSQGYSDLKVALAKGRGSVEETFKIFDMACQDFLRETPKVPTEPARHFLDQVRRLGEMINNRDRSGISAQMEKIKGLKKSCHDQYK